MKRFLKRFVCFTFTLFLIFSSIPVGTMTAYAADDSFELFDAMQAISWNEESIQVILNSEVGQNVTIARSSLVSGGAGERNYYHFSCCGKYYFAGKVFGDKAVGREYVLESDLGVAKFTVSEYHQEMLAFKFSGNESDSNMYWIVCDYSKERTQYKPDGTLASDENEALALAGEYAKENGYRAGLEKYLSEDAADAFEAAYTNYFENPDDECNNAGDSTAEQKRKNEVNTKARSEKLNAILSSLSKLTFTDALFEDPDISRYITEYQTPVKDDSKYKFTEDGPFIVPFSILLNSGDSIVNEFSPSSDRAALRLDVTLDEGIDYWYVVKYDATGKKGSSKKSVLAGLSSLMETAQESDDARDTALDSIDDAGGRTSDSTGADGETGTSISYDEARYERVNKINFNVDPLDELEELDFSSDDNVGLEKLKTTAASFYKFISLIATVGMVISLFLMSVKIMVGGRREAKASIINMIYKFVIFACICGFVNLWALFYPIVQSLT